MFFTVTLGRKSFNLRRLHVKFAGENDTDEGGLSREFISRGLRNAYSLATSQQLQSCPYTGQVAKHQPNTTVDITKQCTVCTSSGCNSKLQHDDQKDQIVPQTAFNMLKRHAVRFENLCMQSICRISAPPPCIQCIDENTKQTSNAPSFKNACIQQTNRRTAPAESIVCNCFIHCFPPYQQLFVSWWGACDQHRARCLLQCHPVMLQPTTSS
jgi:hypothetical protein